MPESQIKDESNSSDAGSDKSDDDNVNKSIQSYSDEEMESNSEKLTCDHCEKEWCSWKDFY